MKIIHWCGLCNSNPASGVLKILRRGNLLPEDVKACQDCVDKIPETGWLEEGYFHA